jgi:hypothetical protein
MSLLGKYGHSNNGKITMSSNPLVWEVVDANFDCTIIKKWEVYTSLLKSTKGSGLSTV